MFVANDGKMAKSRIFLIILALLASLVSCRSHREMVYISDAERDSAQQMLNTYSNSIHTGDLFGADFCYRRLPMERPAKQALRGQDLPGNKLPGSRAA